VQRLFSIIYLFFSIYSFVRCFRQSTCVSNVFILLLRHGTGTSPNEPIAELFWLDIVQRDPFRFFFKEIYVFALCVTFLFFSHCFLYFFYYCMILCIFSISVPCVVHCSMF